MRGVIYGASAAAIWGGMYVVSDVVLEVIPPFTLLMLRLVLGIMTLILLRRGRLPVLSRQPMTAILLIGIVGYGTSLGAQFIGTDLSNAINGAVVTSATPAFVLLFAVFILRERLTALRLSSVVLATIGVIVIIDFSRADFSSATFVGNLFLALAALTWGLYSTLIRWNSLHYPQIDTVDFTILALAGGLLLVIPASVIELQFEPVLWAGIDGPIILGVLFLGIISTAGAMWLWNRAFVLMDASSASILFFVQPLSGAMLGWIFLGQAITPQIVLGGILIAASILMCASLQRRTPATPVRLGKHN